MRHDVAAKTLTEILDLDPRRDEALEALERCQIAMRAWPDVIATLDRRANLARDSAQKGEVLYRMAEIEESKLADLAAALQTYERIARPRSAPHPRARRARAPLGEDAGLGATAAYRARLAQLSSDANQAAQLLVQIGDMLSQPGRDPGSARTTTSARSRWCRTTPARGRRCRRTPSAKGIRRVSRTASSSARR